MMLRAFTIIGLLLAMLIFSCQSDDEVEFHRLYSSGSALYATHCQNCHGKNGEGLGLLIPPLNDSVYLKNNDHQLACYLINGLKGTIKVLNKPFDGAMPASGLAPIEVVEVLTYVKNSFGNKAGLTDVKDVTEAISKCK